MAFDFEKHASRPMSNYNDPYPCPYCGEDTWAEWCDVGVGHVQCGPYHCLSCHASEIGPHDKEDRELTSEEKRTGWYAPGAEPGSSANVIDGKIVTTKEMETVYEARFSGDPDWHDKDIVDEWWKDIRKPVSV